MNTIDLDKEIQTRSKRSDTASTDQRHRDDVQQIARTLAEQHGASKERWPLYKELAEKLIRFSRRWYE